MPAVEAGTAQPLASSLHRASGGFLAAVGKGAGAQGDGQYTGDGQAQSTPHRREQRATCLQPHTVPSTWLF